MKKVRVMALALMVVLLVGVCVACVPTSIDKAESNLQNEGFGVFTATSGEHFDVEDEKYDGLANYLYAVKDGESITIWYFKSTDDAKKAQEEIKTDYVGYTDNKNLKVGRSGVAVYVGTKKAVRFAN